MIKEGCSAKWAQCPQAVYGIALKLLLHYELPKDLECGSIFYVLQPHNTNTPSRAPTRRRLARPLSSNSPHREAISTIVVTDCDLAVATEERRMKKVRVGLRRLNSQGPRS